VANIRTFDNPQREGGPANTDKRALAIVTALFFMWGFVTCLNDILIPHLKAIFSLNYAEVMLLQLCFFLSYGVFAIPAGKLVEKIGYKRAMVVGLCTMAVGALLILPAAAVPAFGLFLGAQVVVAAGMTVLQVAANPYVSIIGPSATASSRLNLTQAFNSLGTFVAPFFGSAFILSQTPLAESAVSKMSAAALQTYRQYEASTVRAPYIGIAATLIFLAVGLGLLRLPQTANTQEFRPKDTDHPVGALLHERQLILAAIGIFVYVGAEVSIGSFLTNYFNQPEIGNLSLKTAANYVSVYWLGAMIGRFVGSAILQKVRTGLLLGIVAVVACLLVILSMLTFGHVAMWTILAVGLFNSVMFPSIFTLGIEGLGPLTGRGSGVLVAAIVGGAVIPFAQGWIADRIGIHHAFILPVLCYVYIAFFGFSRLKKWRPPLADSMPLSRKTA
jgi:FHS family L-fucose permease-like MFS transporter